MNTTLPPGPRPSRPLLSRFSYFLLGFALLSAVVNGCFSYRQTGSLQLASMGLALLWLFLLVAALIYFAQRRPVRWLAAAGVLLTLVFLPYLGGRAGWHLRDAVFRARLPEYEAIVRLALASGEGAIPAPPHLACAVYHDLDDQGCSQVVFFWGRGFPVKHSAFVYHPGEPEAGPEFTRPWDYFRPLAPHWYGVGS